MKKILKLTAAVLAIPVAYIIFENALEVSMPSGWAAAIAVIAALTAGVLIAAPRKR